IDEPSTQPKIMDPDVVGQRISFIEYGNAISPLCCSSLYTSSATGSNHSLLTSWPGITNARWENNESACSPCQCFVPAGTRMTVPGSILTGSSPSAWYQPLPAVHNMTWSPAPFVPWWICQLLRQPGSKVTLLTGTVPSVSGAR